MNTWQRFRRHWLITIFGLILLIVGTCFLIYNEGLTLRRDISLGEAFSDIVHVNPEEPMKATNDGRVVYVSGQIIVGEPLTEPNYNIQVLAVKLRRRVQMYQWIEESIRMENSPDDPEKREYFYTQEWRDDLIDSSQFYIKTGHHNPTKFPVESFMHISDHVNIGHYELSSDAKTKIIRFVEITADARPDDAAIKLHSGLYYHCNDVWNPENGDIRILFAFAGLEGTDYTLIGKQENGKIVPFLSSVNRQVLIVMEGEHTVSAAFKEAHTHNKMISWLFRFVGWLLLFFSITCLSTWFHFFLSTHRLLHIIVPNPSDPVRGNLMLSLSLALIIAAIAWMLYRPWYGCSMIVAAISPYVLCARGFIQY